MCNEFLESIVGTVLCIFKGVTCHRCSHEWIYHGYTTWQSPKIKKARQGVMSQMSQ